MYEDGFEPDRYRIETITAKIPVTSNVNFIADGIRMTNRQLRYLFRNEITLISPLMKNPESHLKVKKSASGLGLFALEPIAKGTRIIEYTGEKISVEEADRRRGMYLFELNSRWLIDGRDRKNTARYINHACGSAANCAVNIRNGRIWISARKSIHEGEELSYDYGKEMYEAYIKPHGCKCANPKHGRI